MNLNKQYSIIGLWLISFILSIEVNAKSFEKTEIIVIPTMHVYHKNHPTYDYNTLYTLVRELKPDFVGVEIRPEDIDADVNYLKKNYPIEMIELARKYKDRVFGFDWLGFQIENQAIPRNYWKNFKIKKLLNSMKNNEAFFKAKPKKLSAFEDKQSEILKHATPVSLSDGRYGQLCREIDLLQEQWYRNWKLEEVIQFDQTRDTKIGQNINNFISKHIGSRIILIMGADHRTFAIENINKQFGYKVEILPLNNMANGT